MENTIAQLNLLVKMTLTAWDAQNGYLDKLINTLSDKQLAGEIAPGRNTGIYLLGHIVAVSDAMLPLLGWGERLYPDLEETFIKMPDKSGQPMPDIAELKEKLKLVNLKLTFCFQSASVDEWLNRHTSVSEEDFIKEPHRNRLNVVISRTNHMANHVGQMLLLK